MARCFETWGVEKLSVIGTLPVSMGTLMSRTPLKRDPTLQGHPLQGCISVRGPLLSSPPRIIWQSPQSPSHRHFEVCHARRASHHTRTGNTEINLPTEQPKDRRSQTMQKRGVPVSLGEAIRLYSLLS